MNTYNENLQATVNQTLAALAAEQARLESVKVASDHTLYYAQGTEITARDALNEARKAEKLHLLVNDQSQLSDSAAYNLQLSASLANTDVGASSTNMATAAANVNIAANAIAVLAADIGSALNNTIASLFDTEVYQQVREANSFINEVANEARETSRVAMDVSSKASEIVAQATLDQSSGFKGRLDELTKTTQAQLESFSNQVVSNTAATRDAVNNERQAEGAARDIDSQVQANVAAYHHANKHLNLKFAVQVVDAHHIEVSFNSRPSILPDFKTLVAHGISIPDADPVYYLMLVPLENASSFSVEQAEQLSIRQAEKPAQVMPDQKQKVTLDKDAYGDYLVAGNSYVAYLYIELTVKYRRFVGNFANILSAPSQRFVLATKLPLAQKYARETPAPSVDKHELKTLYFSIPGHTESIDGLEFRCILVERSKVNSLSLLRSSEFEKAHIYFNVAIARQVAPSNYEVAESIKPHAGKPSRKKAGDAASDADEAALENDSGAQAHHEQAHSYRVIIKRTSTDNFGNPLKPGVSYQPYILSVINSSKNEHSNAYVGVLSDKLSALTWAVV